METITRLIKIELPQGQSAFLWGPRKTGKTTYLRATFPNSRVYDLLQTDLFLEFVKRPFLLREQLLAASPKQLKEPVIIDEVQKVPQLLDEIHWLIENKGLRFILCGSSARKLKRGKANLLGGRAWRYEMHPLVSAEVADLICSRRSTGECCPGIICRRNTTSRCRRMFGIISKRKCSMRD